MLSIDTRIGGARNQFAAQAEKMSKDIKQVIDRNFSGTDSPDFYEGLLAGYANAYQIAQNLGKDAAIEYIGSIIAYVSLFLTLKAKQG